MHLLSASHVAHVLQRTDLAASDVDRAQLLPPILSKSVFGLFAIFLEDADSVGHVLGRARCGYIWYPGAAQAVRRQPVGGLAGQGASASSGHHRPPSTGVQPH